MLRTDVKLIMRYVTVVFFLYLAWYILQPKFLTSVKDIGDIGIGAIYTSILGSAAWIIKANWSTSMDKET